jgi:beta-glucosidase
MSLPPHTDELISSVLNVRPDAVVVTQSGTPVAMPWADQAQAIVQMWYGGNEGGNGLADVLFGDVNPVSGVIYVQMISHADNLYRVANCL